MNERIILIDDDPVNTAICELLIRKTLESPLIVSFIVPEEGLEYLIADKLLPAEPAALLLDLNMPGMNGWELLESLQIAVPGIENRLSIYLLTSSISESDILRAGVHPLVKGYLIKPLKREMISQIEFQTKAG